MESNSTIPVHPTARLPFTVPNLQQQFERGEGRSLEMILEVCIIITHEISRVPLLKLEPAQGFSSDWVGYIL